MCYPTNAWYTCYFPVLHMVYSNGYPNYSWFIIHNLKKLHAWKVWAYTPNKRCMQVKIKSEVWEREREKYNTDIVNVCSSDWTIFDYSEV